MLANLFVGHHGSGWLRGFGLAGVLFCRRCVGGAFCSFRSGADAVQFFRCLDGRHIDVRLTVEGESESGLPFLDVLIGSGRVPVLAAMFRGSAFAGLLVGFAGFASCSYRLGLIRTLIDGACGINSTWLGFHREATGMGDLCSGVLVRHALSAGLLVPLSVGFFGLAGGMATTARSAPALSCLAWVGIPLLREGGFAGPFGVFVAPALVSS